MLRILSIIVILGSLFAAACSKAGSTAAANSDEQSRRPALPGIRPAEAPPPPKPVPVELPQVMARVNGETISKEEFEKTLRAVEGQNGAAVPADQRDRVYRGVLDQIISYRLLLQESRSRQIVVPDADIDARVGQIRKGFPSEEAFKQALDRQKVTVEQLRSDARSEMLVSRMLQKEIESKIAIKPEQVSEFYEKNPDKFVQGETIRASHILIAVPQGADAAAKEQARTKASDVLKDAKAGKDFAALAKQHSQDPGTAANGGDLNYFPQGRMVGPFDQTAFSLKTGEISDLVETQFGYHIIKVTDRRPKRTVPLDEVRQQIQQFLENQSRQQQTQALVTALKAKGKVEIYI